jgi:nucleotide-binding universal stress UspA family protein
MGVRLPPPAPEFQPDRPEVYIEVSIKGELVISKILVPTDGSVTAKKAARYAVELAKQTGVTITLVAVIDKNRYLARSIPATASPTRLMETVEDYLRQAAEGYLKEAERRCGANGVPSRKVIRSGHPVEEIIKEAEKSKIDLIVIGSHGKSAVKAAVLGSVTYGVIHYDTKVPVLVVRR